MASDLESSLKRACSELLMVEHLLFVISKSKGSVTFDQLLEQVIETRLLWIKVTSFNEVIQEPLLQFLRKHREYLFYDFVTDVVALGSKYFNEQQSELHAIRVVAAILYLHGVTLIEPKWQYLFARCSKVTRSIVGTKPEQIHIFVASHQQYFNVWSDSTVSIDEKILQELLGEFIELNRQTEVELRTQDYSRSIHVQNKGSKLALAGMIPTSVDDYSIQQVCNELLCVETILAALCKNGVLSVEQVAEVLLQNPLCGALIDESFVKPLGVPLLRLLENHSLHFNRMLDADKVLYAEAMSARDSRIKTHHAVMIVGSLIACRGWKVTKQLLGVLKYCSTITLDSCGETVKSLMAFIRRYPNFFIISADTEVVSVRVKEFWQFVIHLSDNSFAVYKSEPATGSAVKVEDKSGCGASTSAAATRTTDESRTSRKEASACEANALELNKVFPAAMPDDKARVITPEPVMHVELSSYLAEAALSDSGDSSSNSTARTKQAKKKTADVVVHFGVAGSTQDKSLVYESVQAPGTENSELTLACSRLLMVEHLLFIISRSKGLISFNQLLEQVIQTRLSKVKVTSFNDVIQEPLLRFVQQHSEYLCYDSVTDVVSLGSKYFNEQQSELHAIRVVAAILYLHGITLIEPKWLYLFARCSKVTCGIIGIKPEQIHMFVTSHQQYFNVWSDSTVSIDGEVLQELLGEFIELNRQIEIALQTQNYSCLRHVQNKDSKLAIAGKIPTSVDDYSIQQVCNELLCVETILAALCKSSFLSAEQVAEVLLQNPLCGALIDNSFVKPLSVPLLCLLENHSLHFNRMLDADKVLYAEAMSARDSRVKTHHAVMIVGSLIVCRGWKGAKHLLGIMKYCSQIAFDSCGGTVDSLMAFIRRYPNFFIFSADTDVVSVRVAEFWKFVINLSDNSFADYKSKVASGSTVKVEDKSGCGASTSAAATCTSDESWISDRRTSVGGANTLELSIIAPATGTIDALINFDIAGNTQNASLVYESAQKLDAENSSLKLACSRLCEVDTSKLSEIIPAAVPDSEVRVETPEPVMHVELNSYYLAEAAALSDSGDSSSSAAGQTKQAKRKTADAVVNVEIAGIAHDTSFVYDKAQLSNTENSDLKLACSRLLTVEHLLCSMTKSKGGMSFTQLLDHFLETRLASVKIPPFTDAMQQPLMDFLRKNSEYFNYDSSRHLVTINREFSKKPYSKLHAIRVVASLIYLRQVTRINSMYFFWHCSNFTGSLVGHKQEKVVDFISKRPQYFSVDENLKVRVDETVLRQLLCEFIASNDAGLSEQPEVDCAHQNALPGPCMDITHGLCKDDALELMCNEMLCVEIILVDLCKKKSCVFSASKAANCILVNTLSGALIDENFVEHLHEPVVRLLNQHSLHFQSMLDAGTNNVVYSEAISTQGLAARENHAIIIVASLIVNHGWKSSVKLLERLNCCSKITRDHVGKNVESVMKFIHQHQSYFSVSTKGSKVSVKSEALWQLLVNMPDNSFAAYKFLGTTAKTRVESNVYASNQTATLLEQTSSTVLQVGAITSPEPIIEVNMYSDLTTSSYNSSSSSIASAVQQQVKQSRIRKKDENATVYSDIVQRTQTQYLHFGDINLNTFSDIYTNNVQPPSFDASTTATASDIAAAAAAFANISTSTSSISSVSTIHQRTVNICGMVHSVTPAQAWAQTDAGQNFTFELCALKLTLKCSCGDLTNHVLPWFPVFYDDVTIDDAGLLHARRVFIGRPEDHMTTCRRLCTGINDVKPIEHYEDMPDDFGAVPPVYYRHDSGGAVKRGSIYCGLGSVCARHDNFVVLAFGRGQHGVYERHYSCHSPLEFTLGSLVYFNAERCVNYFAEWRINQLWSTSISVVKTI
jgi:hypothetical protein